MILITAFKPFNNRNENASEEVLKRIDTSSNVYKAYLEVDLTRTIIGFNEALNISKPNMIIMLGEAGRSEFIEIEKEAHNILDFKIVDNMGFKPKGVKILESMADTLNTSLDVDKLVSYLKTNDYKVKESYNAGTFICNCLYYNALLENNNSIFIHLPRLNNDSLAKDIKTMDLDEMIKTIKEIINYYDN